MNKTSPKILGGNFFEDFTIGQEFRHATPRTLTEADAALNTGLFGMRFAINSSDVFAQSLGLPCAPLDDLMVFHVVIAKTVSDISVNAVANLGYAEFRWGVPVYPGDTLSVRSTVLGLRETSDRRSGVVWVRSTGTNQLGEMVLDYVRWVMVRKRDVNAPAPQEQVPTLPRALSAESLGDACPAFDHKHYDLALSGSRFRWADYKLGEKIDHVDGFTVEEAEHQMATRLYQNTAKVHFNQFIEGQGRFGRRLIYGGHVISLARSISFNGLGNAFQVAGINSGRHVAPLFAGATVFAWSEVLDSQPLPGRDDVGALRLRTIATRDHLCADFPYKTGDDYHPDVILDLDYWVLLPR